MASSAMLSHSSSCLLITQVTPLRNSTSDPEKALCESRFHLIVTRYFLSSWARRVCELMDEDDPCQLGNPASL